MLVRFFGFDLTAAPAFPVDEFFKILTKARDKEPVEDKNGRYVFVNSDANEQYHLGLLSR